ncbi:MAG: DUF2520 domain-containing protein [Acidimicrobiia bacterium]|nr:DUF2520 domain-containing protein [Acidimicrobiia bacterium]
MTSVRIVGPGRAGSSLARALGRVDGWDVQPLVGRDGDVAGAAAGVDLLVIATPDRSVGAVSDAVAPVPSTVVAHLSGSLGLEVLGGHERTASVHPLMALPDADVGARRLAAGGWFAIAGDPLAARVVDALGGRAFEVRDRVLYHAAACIAANHLVALMGQVERVAAMAGVPLEAYLELARGSLDDVAALGPAAAITGPAARSDDETLDRHRAALDPSERDAYDAMAALARRLVAS